MLYFITFLILVYWMLDFDEPETKEKKFIEEDWSDPDHVKVIVH